MRPDTPQHPATDSRGTVPTPVRDGARQKQAVANMTREQIAAIYAHQPAEAISPAPQTTSQPQPSAAQTQPTVVQPLQPATQHTEEPKSVYDRTHEPAHTVDTKQWEHYHSQWQQYYQQYYEQYYSGAVKQTHTAYQQHAAKLREQLEAERKVPETMSEAEALQDLRSQLRQKVQKNAQKVRKSRHFVPAISALVVLLGFLFLQYNAMLIAYAQAYISPGNIDPQNIIIDPNASLEVDPAPKLIIPKINVDIAVDYNAKPDYASQMAAMKTSVAYFGIAGANSKPGQLGNVPLSGHSSNDFTDSGEAKFIFARLDKLQEGDPFYLNYDGIRYTYAVKKIMVVMPNEVTRLQLGTEKPYATLITCTPLGTAQKRLLVVGEQVSPAPSKATVAPDSVGESAPNMAGQSPTIVERLFGAQ